jgi:hypothetical protein
VVVEGKIFSVPAVRARGVDWLQVARVQKVLAALGARVDYDPEGPLLAVTSPAAGRPSLPPPRGEALTVVFNSTILKTGCLRQGSDLYLPVQAVAGLARALGGRTSLSAEEGVLTVSGANPAASTASSPASTRSVPEYMNALKAVYDSHKPTAADRAKWQRLSVDPRGLTVEDIRAIRVKYQAVLDGTRALAPPPAECREIHQLSLETFTKMVRILDLSAEMLETQDTSKISQIQDLQAECQTLAQRFDEKVRAIRKKYHLGPP